MGVPDGILRLDRGSVGLAFVAAGFADLALGRKPRGRRAYVPLIPLAAYLAWWLGWGQSAGGQIGPDTVLHTPRYLLEAAAEGVVSLLGREPVGADGHPLLMAQALLVVLIGPGSFTLTNARPEPARTLIGRFAKAPSVDLGRIPGGAERTLAIPADDSNRSWMLVARGQPLRLCEAQVSSTTHRVARDAGLPLRQS